MIYHITSRRAWEESQKRGHYSAPSLLAEGFIHCSNRFQVLGVANNFYRGETDQLLLCIDECKLDAPLVWEAPLQSKPVSAEATSLDATFPHLYGVLNLDAIAAVFDFSEAESGFALPIALP